MSLQEKLVSLRKEKGLSQLEVAESVNVSRQAISKWEVGTAVPSIDNLKSLSALYGVSVDTLLDDSAVFPAQEIGQTEQDWKDLERRFARRGKLLVVLVCALALVSAFSVYLAVSHEQERGEDEIIPISELEVVEEDENEPYIEFELEWP